MAPAQAEDAADYPSRKIRMLSALRGRRRRRLIGRFGAKEASASARPSSSKTAPVRPVIIGTQRSRPAAADGHTITIGGMTMHVLAPAVYPSLPDDPIRQILRDHRPHRKSSISLVVTNDFGASDVGGIRPRLAKSGPTIQYCTWGVGSTGQFRGEIR